MKTVMELEEGERIVEKTSVCVNCLEPIYFGTIKRQAKKWDKYYDGWKNKNWRHENGYIRCEPKQAEPMSGNVIVERS